mgnify:CR=1 FL=1
MLEAVTAVYNGGNVFIMDENLSLQTGQRVIITVLDEGRPADKPIDISKYSGSAGNMFGSTEAIDEYVRGLRDNDRL